MTESERKIKKRVQLVVAGSMAVFFCLLVTLVVQLAIRANQTAMLNSLNATHERLVEEKAKAVEDHDKIADDRFIDEWLLRELGYGHSGSHIWER